ncbi:hypothetical protein PBAT_08650 [Paenibacillus antarcticus]|uniref:Uncharacterized protein n=1 Tax=Paenibacillus antarcticus TaxID=253703 RepID=A0A168PGH6_9BACL|nr:hypothetical protein PBAT_08650 [Paenibacillus antarcticus]
MNEIMGGVFPLAKISAFTTNKNERLELEISESSSSIATCSDSKPDIVVLRAKNHYFRRKTTVFIISQAGEAPAIPTGMELAAALQILINAGFIIKNADADSCGFYYTLIRVSSSSGPIDFFKDRLGQTLTIESPAGAVSGVLIYVGTDFIQLEESTGDLVLIPLASIISVS